MSSAMMAGQSLWFPFLQVPLRVQERGELCVPIYFYLPGESLKRVCFQTLNFENRQISQPTEASPGKNFRVCFPCSTMEQEGIWEVRVSSFKKGNPVLYNVTVRKPNETESQQYNIRYALLNDLHSKVHLFTNLHNSHKVPRWRKNSPRRNYLHFQAEAYFSLAMKMMNSSKTGDISSIYFFVIYLPIQKFINRKWCLR